MFHRILRRQQTIRDRHVISTSAAPCTARPRGGGPRGRGLLVSRRQQRVAKHKRIDICQPALHAAHTTCGVGQRGEPSREQPCRSRISRPDR